MIKFIPYIFAAILLFIPRPSLGQTYIIPVDDLLMSVPNFSNAPDFNLNNAMNGNLPIGTHTKQPRKKIPEQELLDLAWTLFPTAENIKVWNCKLIVKFKD
jgi:hypothetical protein